MRKTFAILIALLMNVVCITSIQAMEFDVLGGVDIHGFISQGFLQTDQNNFFGETEKGTFEFNEMGVNFSTDLTDRLHIGAQFFARDFGDIGNNQMAVDWAFADYHWSDYLGFLAGRMKIVHGLYNETRDVDMLRTPIFLPQVIYNEGWREMTGAIQGAAVYGEVPMSSLGSLTYNLQFGTVNMPNDGGNAKILVDQLSKAGIDYVQAEIVKTKIDHMGAGSIQWYTPLTGLRMGFSIWDTAFDSKMDMYADAGYVGNGIAEQLGETLHILEPGTSVSDLDDATINTIITAASTASSNIGQLQAANTATEEQIEQKIQLDAALATYAVSQTYEAANVKIQVNPLWVNVKSKEYTISGEYTLGEMILAAEYEKVHFEIDGGAALKKDFYSESYYGSVSYRVNDWLELGTYYGEYYPNVSDKDGDKLKAAGGQAHRQWLKDWAITTRFDLNEGWVLKLEGHAMDGAAQLLETDNPNENNEWVSLDQDMYSNSCTSNMSKKWFLGAAKVTYSF